MPKLVLYHFEGCPFCIRVRRYLSDRGISVQERDTMLEPGAASDLVKIGGKSQVPCLIIDGKPLYESADIINWFENNYDG